MTTSTNRPVGNIFLGRFTDEERSVVPAMRRAQKRARLARVAREAYLARLGDRRVSAFGEVA